MYAVVEIGGHQYRVAEGDVLYVDKQNEESGETLEFDRVLLINDNGTVAIGKPTVEGASVKAELLDNVKADKVMVFKKKRRKGYQVKRGHRQPMSQIEISSISAKGGTSKKKTKKTKPKKKKETETAKAEQEQQQLSTDMKAKEAIKHIRNTPLEELEGFVPDSEDRVTVQRAWDSKQEDE